MKISLTDTFLLHKVEGKAKATGKPQCDFFDAPTPGLCLRVTQAGKKTWTFVYTTPKDGVSRVRITLGTYPAITLADARIMAGEKRLLVEQGQDPKDVVPSLDLTVAQLIEQYLDEKVREQLDPKTGKVKRKALRSQKDIESRFYKKVVPVIGHMLIKDFKVKHLHDVLKPIKDAGSLRMAGMVGADLKALFKYAAYDIGQLENGSPIAGTTIASGLTVKKTNLTVGEITDLWTGMDEAFPKSVAVRRILKLILLTGCRVSEVAECRREEFDTATGIWTIPAGRVKNGDDYGDHMLPLSDEALAIVRDAMRDTNGDWLFPNRAGDGPINNHVVSMTLRRAQELGKLGTKKWTPHDLRRTFVTQMLNEDHEFGYVEYDVALVVNHVSTTKGTVTAKHYNGNVYLKKKHAVLATWGAFITKLVNPPVQLMAAE